MKTEQISVFLENRTGRLCEVTKVLAEANINIRALSLADTSDFGILRMIVCDPQEAAKVLKKSGFAIGINHVVAVAVEARRTGRDRADPEQGRHQRRVHVRLHEQEGKERHHDLPFRQE